MGATGKYKIEYHVNVQQLRTQLNQVQGLVSQHARVLNSPTIGQVPIVPQTAQQTAALNAVTKNMNAQTAQAKLAMQAQNALNQSQKQGAGSAMTLGKQIDNLQLALSRMVLWWGSAALIMGGKELISTIQEVAGNYQYAVRELTVMGDEGEATYKRLAMSSFDWAADTARSFEEANQAMQEWLRQGYSSVEIAELTRNTLIGLNLAQMSTSGLVKTLTAEMRAYNIPASESISIIDKLVGVERKYAVSSEELAVGLRRFASVANEANVTMDQQIALMTAMIVRTQQAPESVGTAARTMLIRLTGVGTKVIETIAKVNVYADEQNRTFRSSWDILSDLASKWNTYDDVQKKQIATAVAGVRQQEFFIALMKDFDLAIESNIVSLGSAGLAYRANMQLMDTYKGAVGALKAEWDKLLSSQSGILDMFTDITRGLKEIITVLGSIPKEVAAFGPAIVVGLGAALTKINPLLGIITMASGAFLELSRIMGRTGVNVDEVLRKGKDLTDAQYLEAKSASDLAKEYIRLYQLQQKGADNAKLLTSARDQLNKLMPTLLGNETDLSKVYNILNGQIDSLDQKTQRLAKTRQDMQKAELQRQLTEAQQGVSGFNISPELQARGISRANINNISELQRLRDYLSQAIVPLSKEPSQGLLQMVEDEMRQEALLNFKKGLAPPSLLTEESRTAEVRKRALERNANAANKIFGQIADIDELLSYLTSIQYTTEALSGIGTTKATEDVIEMGEAPSPERDIQTRLRAAQLQAELDFYNRAGKIETDKIAKAEQDKMLQQEIFDTSIKFLEAQEKTEEVEKLLLEYRAGGVEYLMLQKDLLLATYGIQADLLDAQEQRQERDKKNLQELRDLQTQMNAETIERGQGRLAAIEYRIAAASRVLAETRAEYEKVPLTDIRGKEAARSTMADASLNVEKLRLQHENERTKIAEETETLNARIAKRQITLVREQREIEITSTQAAKEAMEEYKTKYDSILKANLGLEDQTEVLKAQLDYIDSQINYQEELNKDKKASLDIDQKLREVQLDAQVESLRLRGGEYVAALKLVELRQQEYDIAEPGLKQQEALLNLEKARNDLHLIYLDQLKDEKQFQDELTKQAGDANLRRRVSNIRYIMGEGPALAENLRVATMRSIAWQGKLSGMSPSNIDYEKTQNEAKTAIREQQSLQEDYDDFLSEQEERRRQANLSYFETQRQHEYDMIELTKGKVSMLKAEIQDMELINLEARDKATMDERANVLQQKRNELTKTELELSRERTIALIQYASTLGTDIIGATVGGNKFNWGSAISGGAGLVSSLMFAANPVLGAGIAAGGAVIGALVDNMTSQDKNTEVINLNTVAIDRNTQTLNDVFAKAINIPTSFMMPAVLTHYGMVPSAHTGGYVERGGLVNVKAGESIGNVGSLTININGANQSADQIANKVMYVIERKWSIQARSGGVTPLLAS